MSPSGLCWGLSLGRLLFAGAKVLPDMACCSVGFVASPFVSIVAATLSPSKLPVDAILSNSCTQQPCFPCPGQNLFPFTFLCYISKGSIPISSHKIVLDPLRCISIVIGYILAVGILEWRCACYPGAACHSVGHSNLCKYNNKIR